MKDFTNTDFIFCELCDNMVFTIWCDECMQDVCHICHEAYPEDYCG